MCALTQRIKHHDQISICSRFSIAKSKHKNILDIIISKEQSIQLVVYFITQHLTLLLFSLSTTRKKRHKMKFTIVVLALIVAVCVSQVKSNPIEQQNVGKNDQDTRAAVKQSIVVERDLSNLREKLRQIKDRAVSAVVLPLAAIPLYTTVIVGQLLSG